MQLWRLTDSHLSPGNPRRGFEMMKMRRVHAPSIVGTLADGSAFAFADRTRPLFRIDAERVRAFVHR
jgi:hypothetical protein